MQKVLFLAYYFPPAGGAGVQRAQKFAQFLPSEGFLPVVVTGASLPEDRWSPQDRSLLHSIPREVEIHSVEQPLPSPPGKLRSRLEVWMRLRSSFSRWWIRGAIERGIRVGSNASLIFATMSPFESAEAALQLSQRLGIPWVADLRDPWALDEMRVYPTWLHRKLDMRKMERLLSTAAAIIMNTPEATKALKTAFPGLRQERIFTITNGFDPSDFPHKVESRADGKFRIVHSGYLHTELGLNLRNKRFNRLLGQSFSGVDIFTRSHAILLQALERWCSARPELKHVVELVLAGKTSAADRGAAEHSPIASLIKFPGYLSHQESTELVATADVLFLPMQNLSSGRRSRIVPGKTYEYMATGKPILAAVPDGDAKDFLANCGTAFICRPDDIETMIRLLDELYSRWKNNELNVSSNHAFLGQFTRRHLTSVLAGVFESVLAPVAAPGRSSSYAPPATAGANL